MTYIGIIADTHLLIQQALQQNVFECIFYPI